MYTQYDEDTYEPATEMNDDSLFVSLLTVALYWIAKVWFFAFRIIGTGLGKLSELLLVGTIKGLNCSGRCLLNRIVSPGSIG